MRTLADLLASPDGRDFLERREVFTDPPAFVEAMATPQCDDLLTPAGLPAGSLVPFTGQQAQCDYAHTVTAKFRVLRDLAQAPDIVPTARRTANASTSAARRCRSRSSSRSVAGAPT